MAIETLRTLFKRDLDKLKKEIETYRTEENLWHVADGISNSGGNLCLHLTGNLLHFFGAVLGKTGYIRQRDHEFSARNIPRHQLISQIEETMIVVDGVLANMAPAKLEEAYPIPVFKEKTSTGYFLAHLSTHLSYHLGQINYHRRLLDHT